MAGNREKGASTIEANGQTYTLVLDINALVALEDLFSTPDKLVTFNDIIARVNSGSVKYVRAFVWAALQAHHPEMTLADAGRLITDAGGLEGFSKQMAALAGTTTPDPADLKELGVNGSRPHKAQAVKPRRGTGESSTSTHGALA